MTQTKHADYLASAKANLEAANRSYSPEQYSGHITAAQAMASIALAEELRTANLLAYLKLTEHVLLPEETPGHVRITVQRQVEQRLGLA